MPARHVWLDDYVYCAIPLLTHSMKDESFAKLTLKLNGIELTHTILNDFCKEFTFSLLERIDTIELASETCTLE